MKDKFIEICSRYKGHFKNTGYSIEFINKNTLKFYSFDEEKYVQKKIECTVGLYNDTGALYASEKTGAVLGGISVPTVDCETLLMFLRKYCFVSRNECQLNIWDVLDNKKIER